MIPRTAQYSGWTRNKETKEGKLSDETMILNQAEGREASTKTNSSGDRNQMERSLSRNCQKMGRVTEVSFCFCSLLLVPQNGRTCSAWFLQSLQYLPQGFLTVDTQTNGSACWSPSYSCTSPPAPRPPPAACFQVSFPARKVLVERSPVIISQVLNWGRRMMHLKERVWVPIYAPMRCFSVNVPNHAREIGLMRTWPKAWKGWKGPDLPGFLSLYLAETTPGSSWPHACEPAQEQYSVKSKVEKKGWSLEIVNKYWGSWLKNKFL